MSQDDWERTRRGVNCPNCGASNWPDAEFCSTCGTVLPRDAADTGGDDGETIIDVSSGEPHVVVRDEPAATGWPNSLPGFPFGSGGGNVRGRTVVMRGGRGCLIPLLLLALLSCCSCWLIWQGFDSVF